MILLSLLLRKLGRNQATFKVIDMNEVMKDSSLLRSLSRMTINPISGMSKSLMEFQKLERKIDAVAIVAFIKNKPIAWALHSKEETSTIVKFCPEMGIYFQVFVDYPYRRRGIANQLLLKSKELANGTSINVADWSKTSSKFYHNKNVTNIWGYHA